MIEEEPLPEACGTIDTKMVVRIDGRHLVGKGEKSKFKLSKEPEKEPEVITWVDPCAPDAPTTVSSLLPGFFVGCLEGGVTLTNTGPIEPGKQWGIKTPLCEVVSNHINKPGEVSIFDVEHVGDCTIIHNNRASTGPLLSIARKGRSRSVINNIPPGTKAVYFAEGRFEQYSPGALYLTDLRLDLKGAPHLTSGLLELAGSALSPIVLNHPVRWQEKPIQNTARESALRLVWPEE